MDPKADFQNLVPLQDGGPAPTQYVATATSQYEQRNTLARDMLTLLLNRDDVDVQFVLTSPGTFVDKVITLADEFVERLKK